jgi:hypothetical protein
VLAVGREVVDERAQMRPGLEESRLRPPSKRRVLRRGPIGVVRLN